MKKSSFGQVAVSKQKQQKYQPLKGFSEINFNSKKSKELIKKIAEPFIIYKNQQRQQTQINIAGYKTLGYYPNHQKQNSSKNQYTISKQSIEKYIYTFCFEVRCQLPSEQEKRLIYALLIAHSEANSRKSEESNDQRENQKFVQNLRGQLTFPRQDKRESIKKSSFYLLIKLCLSIYVKSKQQNIGGIIQRLIIGIRKQIQSSDDSQQNLQSSQDQFQ